MLLEVFVATLAAILLVMALFSAFRFAMGLRYAKLLRERALLDQLGRGRRLVAEVPTPDGDVRLFLEDGERFYWGDVEIGKPGLVGARLLLNGGVMGECRRPEVPPLPPPEAPEEYEGRERWEVVIHTRAEAPFAIACGSLREGVSRDAARSVFRALEAACAGGRSR